MHSVTNHRSAHYKQKITFVSRFGNVAADTDTEKTFTLCMMIISSLLYAAIFGHVTTIIHNMTLATAKYHDMLDGVRSEMETGSKLDSRLCSLPGLFQVK